MTQPTDRLAASTPRWALPIGVLILFIDGYDLFVLGAVGPSLLDYSDWDVSSSTLGLLGSVTALGMPLGAFVAAVLGVVAISLVPVRHRAQQQPQRTTGELAVEKR
ncbi:hypothetical protein [Nocardia rhizosphaerae]|uniref:MFS transporter n=1 Tax=Nocardia rhizosphaerae TaxID=1691571 RepID=A0ABV8LBS9_9NOCA